MKGGGAYQQALGILYAVAYTLKMSYKTDYKMEGFLNMLFRPYEGFCGRIMWKVDYSDKSSFSGFRYSVAGL